ncbi:MAG: AraC family transcriptional regulator ligand-binding domain-containing protein [Polyangiaceae bacterium]
MDGRALARAAGVPPEVLDDPEARLSSDTLDRFVAMAAEASGDPAFALAFAQQHRSISYHLYFAMAASDTLMDAWSRVERYRHLVSDRLDVRRVPAPEGDVRFSFSVPEPDVGRWIPNDMLVATHVLGARGFTMDPDLAPLRIELRRPRPATIAAFEELFRCPLAFGQEQLVVTWKASDVERPQPLANPTIAMQAEGVVVDYLAKLSDADIPDRLRALLVRDFAGRAPRAGRRGPAPRVELSPRSLARSLAARGTTYRDIVDDVRRTLARDYLRAGASVTEITFLLGSLETSALTRAFRRWTGQTPSAFAAAAKAASRALNPRGRRHSARVGRASCSPA